MTTTDDPIRVLLVDDLDENLLALPAHDDVDPRRLGKDLLEHEGRVDAAQDRHRVRRPRASSGPSWCRAPASVRPAPANVGRAATSTCRSSSIRRCRHPPATPPCAATGRPAGAAPVQRAAGSAARAGWGRCCRPASIRRWTCAGRNTSPRHGARNGASRPPMLGREPGSRSDPWRPTRRHPFSPSPRFRVLLPSCPHGM